MTPIALRARLRVVAPVADYRTAVTAGAAHALWPAVLAHEGEALGVVQQPREVDQVRCSHDGRSSSREPVGYSRSSYHTRCPPNALPRPTTPEPDKSLTRYPCYRDALAAFLEAQALVSRCEWSRAVLYAIEPDPEKLGGATHVAHSLAKVVAEDAIHG